MKDPFPYRRSFTLTKLLVVVALIALLLALLMPSLKLARDQAKGVICINNLRQCGLAARLYIGECDGFLFQYHYDNATAVSTVWWQQMQRTGYLSTSNVVACPSWPPFQVSTNQWIGYGIRRDIPNEYWALSDTPVAIAYSIRTIKVRSPADFFVYGDSIGGRSDLGNLNLQGTIAEVWGTWNGNFHLRHAGKANLWFLDGHVEAAGAQRIVEAVLKDGNVTIKAALQNGARVQIYP